METISRFCYKAALAEIERKINDDRIRVENRAWDHVELCVNWSCIGYTEPAEAVKFAAAMTRAAEIAANHPMNGARIVH